MLQFDDVVCLGGAVRGVRPSTIIEDVAVLVDFDKGRSFVFSSPFEDGSEMFDVHVDGSSDKGTFTANCD